MAEAKLSKEEIVSKGRSALNLLQDDTFSDAVDKVKEAITARWEMARSVKRREEQHAQLKALDLVLIELMTFANNGKQVQLLLDKAEAKVRGPGTSQRQGA